MRIKFAGQSDEQYVPICMPCTTAALKAQAKGKKR